MSDMFVFENINKVYPGVKALDSVNFSLKQGEIHCLVGENGSGKSTLIKIISGVEQPEPNARMKIDGDVVKGLNAYSSITMGIRVIYQDLALFPNLTVKENIAFGLYSETQGFHVNWKEVTSRAKQASEMIGLELDLDKQVFSLSIAERQLVEIARSIIGNPKLLILDEPTASLTRSEVDRLFDIIKLLKSRSVTTLFVSHKLNEIFEIAERVTVLRDGEKVGVYKPGDLDRNYLTYLMTGEKIHIEPPQPLDSDKKELMVLKGLSKKNNFSDISFILQEGEILGITGRLGSGRTELALSLFGMNPADKGSIHINGKECRLRNNESSISEGIAYVPENRLEQGLLMPQSINSNITVTVLDKLKTFVGLLDFKTQLTEANRWIKELSIKIPGIHVPVKTLSGGNQQKVVLSKWLAKNPEILILDEPTVGIDVIARNSVHNFIKKMAVKGMGIILISDEINEVLSNCHRVLIMESGRIIDEVIPGQVSEKEILERFNLA